MTDPTLIVPLLLCFGAGLLAWAFRHPALNARVPITTLSWLLAAAPAAAFALLFARLGPMEESKYLSATFDWLPTLGLRAGLYYDGLSALFALLVTGIGAAVTVYTGYYFKGDQSAWRFLAYLLLFMTSMLGLVMAGDVITLFVFWEGTSILSFLLVAYKYKDEAARKGAFKALVITGGGGIALLGGVLFLSSVAGGGDWKTIFASGEAIRSSPASGIMLGLIAFGAFTKSAQFPAHIWLPNAMSAPTPASAYLHSATMVKAGIYLMARLNPVFGPTDAWFWLLSGFGLTTMLVGAYLGLKQHDLKAVLAYSTVSQLGVLMALIGQESEIASKALVIGILAHALYKSALFLTAGIVDHGAHTRDLRRLGGLAGPMRATFAVTGLAALSMAGLPPLFGFLAKETLLATAIHPGLPPVVELIFPFLAVLAGALILAQAAMLVVDTFLGRPRDPDVHAHEAPAPMWLMPAVPAALSLLFALPIQPEPIEAFLARAAGDSFGGKVKVSLELFTGINAPLMLSVIAISLGALLFAFRRQVRAAQNAIGRDVWNAVYDGFERALDGLAWLANRSQNGKIRAYLSVMLGCMAALLLLFARLPWPASLPPTRFDALELIYVAALALTVGASAVTLVLKRDFAAILALGASGLGVALLMTLEPTPDVALVQIVVDILTTVILILALSRIPRAMRQRANELHLSADGWKDIRHAAMAIGAAVVMGLIAYSALTSRPRTSLVTPFYEQNAKPLTGAYDVVGAIVVDFRGFDTLIEITVFSVAGIAVYTLLQFATKKHNDTVRDEPHPGAPTGAGRHTLMGIAGYPTSPFARLLGKFMLPFALLIASVHMMYGHEQPGDGFTAGVIVSMAIGLSYVLFGYAETKRRAPWARPSALIPIGIMLVILPQTAATWMGGAWFSPYDFGQVLGLPLPKGFFLSTSFFFELAICLTVIGSVSFMLDTLGRPATADPDTAREQSEIEALKRHGAVTGDEAGPRTHQETH